MFHLCICFSYKRTEKKKRGSLHGAKYFMSGMKSLFNISRIWNKQLERLHTSRFLSSFPFLFGLFWLLETFWTIDFVYFSSFHTASWGTSFVSRKTPKPLGFVATRPSLQTILKINIQILRILILVCQKVIFGKC